MWKKFLEFLRRQPRNPVFPWVVAFILGCLVIPQHGDQLELPRMLALRAMADDHSFQIGRYIDWTDEWSRTPDGRYYNNRAPGPAFVGFPVFFTVDRLLVRWREHGKVDVKGRRPWPGYELRASTSFWMQELPFSLLVLFAASWLLANGVPIFAVHFFALAALFGNTATIFMNNWSGHGVTATCVLGIFLALLHRKYFYMGLAFGFALLNEYGTAMLILPMLAAIFYQEKKSLRWMLPFFAGGFFPGVLWVWYHVVAFGSAFLTANHFQNPMYVDVHTQGNILGIFKPFPDLPILWKLLFGAHRGIWPTQPWVLIFAPLALWITAWKKTSHDQRLTLIFAFPSLCFLLWMNSMFGGWHAGNTAGPRYLCLIFPVWAFFVAIYWKEIPRWGQWALELALAAALVFRGLVFATQPFPGIVPLWTFHWHEIIHKKGLTNWLRLGIYVVLLAGAYYFVRRNKTIAPEPREA